MGRATEARVFRDHLRHNAGRVRSAAPRSKIMACVKGNGYGHGIVAVARNLQGLVEGFAVACLEEALLLREAGISDDILLLEGPHKAAEIPEAAARGLTLCICAHHQLEWLEAYSKDTAINCWLKIDTGMHRLGIAAKEAQAAYRRLLACTAEPASIVLCTHFAQADERDNPATARQMQCFDAALTGLPATQSCANSAAILHLPDSHRDWVRPGYMLYGGSPFADSTAAELGLLPAMEFATRVISLCTIDVGERVGYGGRWQAQRESRIATLAVGYGDGYPRSASDGTPVLIEGHRSPLAGRVSMDMITVDVTDNPAVKIGSRAVLWGTEPSVDEIASRADTIGYELLAGMPQRVPRKVQ